MNHQRALLLPTKDSHHCPQAGPITGSTWPLHDLIHGKYTTEVMHIVHVSDSKLRQAVILELHNAPLFFFPLLTQPYYSTTETASHNEAGRPSHPDAGERDGGESSVQELF